MPRWFLRFLLFMFFYCLSIEAVGRTANGLAYLLARAGSPDLWQILHVHIFGRAIVVGLLAGLVLLWTWIAATGLMDSKYARYLRRLNPDRLKPWAFVFLSPFILVALLNWTLQWLENRDRYASVLQSASLYPVSQFFRGFLSTDCSYAGNVEFWGEGYGISCVVHVQSIAVWLIAIGYSVAPFVRNRVLPCSTANIRGLRTILQRKAARKVQ
ncbi:MAG: hypothetical protein ABSE99_04395 [Terracidiphilus sp.]|jgi:hypothetical protein